MQGWKGPCLARSPGVRVGLSRGCACRSHCNSDGGDMLSSASCRTNTTANRITRTEWCDYSSFARWTPNQRFEAGGARRLGNESFFSAPQLKRDPLGGCFHQSMKALLRDYALAVGWYVALIVVGLVVTLTVSSAVGYLPYSDRPGPGWIGPAFSFGQLGFYASWGVLLLIPTALYGSVLFAYHRLLRWLDAPL